MGPIPGLVPRTDVGAPMKASAAPDAAGTPPRRPRAWGLALVCAVLLVSYAGNFALVRAATGADGPRFFFYYPLFFGALFLVYLAGVRLTWAGGLRVAMGAIALGTVFRLVMLHTPIVLSSDPYRYLWDGRVQMAGINPYLHAPEAGALVPLRDPDIHPRINRPWAPTIYPPGAQLLFAALAWIAPDRLWTLRLLVTLCELATMVLLLALLRRLGVPEGRVAVYAWAPLPIFEFAQAGHIDAALIPLALGALLARIRGRPALAGALLGGATLVKLYPAILLPVLWQRKALRLPLAFLATMALGYLPYAWGIGWKVAGFLPTYFARFEDFNVGLRALLTQGIGLRGDLARQVVMGILAAVLAAVLLAIARRRAETPGGLAAACGAAVGAYLLLIPATMHPWYVVWLVPFLVVLPGAGWWYLSAAVALSYVGYAADPHQVPVWARVIEYVPAYALVLLGPWGPAVRPAWIPGWISRAKVAPEAPGGTP